MPVEKLKSRVRIMTLKLKRKIGKRSVTKKGRVQKSNL